MFVPCSQRCVLLYVFDFVFDVDWYVIIITSLVLLYGALVIVFI